MSTALLLSQNDSRVVDAPTLEQELADEYPYPLPTIVIKEAPVTGISAPASMLDKTLSLLNDIKYERATSATDNATNAATPLVPDENLRCIEESEIQNDISQELR